MGLLQNTETLEKLDQYLSNTNFGTKAVGNSLTLSFLPPKWQGKLEDKRYTFEFKHRVVTKMFTDATYGEVLVDLAIELNNGIKNISKETKELYETVGLIQDNKCTKELISTIISGGIAMNPKTKIGNTVKKHKYTDNLQNIFDEFDGNTVDYFLRELDDYEV